jgi:radical SAM superfamily enzyme YgiQ (UPF0313 family)
MMRVCLVSAPTETDFEDSVVLERSGARSRRKDYPLGILALAAMLEQNGIPVQIVDLNCWYVDFLVSGGTSKGLGYGCYAAARLAELDCPVAGFGSICSSYPLTLRIAEQLKKLRPDTLTVLGGPQASVVDAATLKHFPCVDFILRGEADCTLPEFIRAAARGGCREELPGLTWRRNGEVVRNADAPVIMDLDALPLPAFHLYPEMGGARMLPLEHGRGCPFDCTFCSTNNFFRRRFRLKSPAKMMREMDLLQARYGVEYFDLMHDMFTVDRRKVVEFCRALLASGKQYRWGCSARTDCVDRELLALMREAGCVSIFYGVETGSQRMQRIIHKDLDLREALASVQFSCELGMATVDSMIIGYPEERREDLRATLGFIGESLRHENAEPHLHLLAPLAGTPLHHRHREELVPEEIYNDISHNRLSQDAVERGLILAYPDLFPNFYSLPTPHLERRYLQELRMFFVRAISRFRWLLVAWHDRCGDLLALFDEWKSWSASHAAVPAFAELRRYYSTWEFDREFVRFLLGRPARETSILEETLIEFEVKLLRALDLNPQGAPEAMPGDDSAAPSSPVITSDMLVSVARQVYPLRLKGNMKRAIELLREKSAPDDSLRRASTVVVQSIPGKDRFRLVEITPALADFLDLCDGRASVDEALTSYAAKAGDFEGIPAWQVAVQAMRTLHRRKLIRFSSGPATGRLPALEPQTCIEPAQG